MGITVLEKGQGQLSSALKNKMSALVLAGRETFFCAVCNLTLCRHLFTDFETFMNDLQAQEYFWIEVIFLGVLLYSTIWGLEFFMKQISAIQRKTPPPFCIFFQAKTYEKRGVKSLCGAAKSQEKWVCPSLLCVARWIKCNRIPLMLNITHTGLDKQDELCMITVHEVNFSRTGRIMKPVLFLTVS